MGGALPKGGWGLAAEEEARDSGERNEERGGRVFHVVLFLVHFLEVFLLPITPNIRTL